MITLENTSRRMQVFNLDGEGFAKLTDEHGPQSITVATVDHLRSGALLPNVSEKKVAASLTLLAGEKRSRLPDAILTLDVIKGAVARGELRVVDQANEPPVDAVGTVRYERDAAQKESTR